MSKPWGRYELDFINHDKFRAINANAISLWWEGKSYCDLRHTDGLIPLPTAKQFRFYSAKAVQMLTTSAGEKPGTGRPYVPLWEVIEGFGFKMHNYLKHNDPRDVVLDRIAKADAERARKKENQKHYRDRRKAEKCGHVTDNGAGHA